MKHLGNQILLVSLALLAVAVDPRQAAKAQPKANCGTTDAISERIGRCMDPIFEIVEGKVAEPKSDRDLVACCARFAEAEKCVRSIARDCLTGIQKTSTSAVASATRRFRVNECKSTATRAKYFEPMKCAIKKGPDMVELFKRSTAITQALRDLSATAPEEKLMKACCLLIWIDKEMETRFNSECPASTPAVIGIVHAMTDDARSTLCVNPKCEKALDARLMNSKYKQKQNLIEPMMQILFELGGDAI